MNSQQRNVTLMSEYKIEIFINKWKQTWNEWKRSAHKEVAKTERNSQILATFHRTVTSGREKSKETNCLYRRNSLGHFFFFFFKWISQRSHRLWKILHCTMAAFRDDAVLFMMMIIAAAAIIFMKSKRQVNLQENKSLCDWVSRWQRQRQWWQ